ncbi:hypothetical protein SOCE26_034400 [Sorangium cellulosum]|uniref:Secreted protein n=1 Tax=Sorangium cellulosum TaxID=56 RepID=A0A2L0ERV3_SORCE|nr:hypothetical protein [Sorangium cellulosum]AUX42015.1 hypothetical protein SOCE26_034400 [Sorangium cellulosum]
MSTRKTTAAGWPQRARRAAAAALAGAAAVAASLAGAPSARAEADGAYGRLDGDLDLRAGVGASFAAGGPALAARGAAAYLSTAGLYVHYTDALGREAAPAARSIATGVFLQPLFLARYASDLERGPPLLDLFLDSFAIGVGSFWEAPRGAGLASEPGLELSLSLGVPLLGDATGPFLDVRGALRFRGPELAGDEGGREEQRALVSVTLSWHHVLRVHLVDAGDRVSARGRAPARVAARGDAAGARGP